MKRVFLALSLGLSVAQAAVPLNHIVATVNESVITQYDIDQQVAVAEKSLAKNGISLPPRSELSSQILSQTISKELILQRAHKTGIRANETEINEAIARVAKERQETVAEFYATAQKDGFSRAALREHMKEEILIHKTEQRDVANTIRISPQEVDDYMRSSAGQMLNKTEYHLEDILIALPNTPSPAQIAEIRANATTIVTELRAGKEFKTIAAAESQGEDALTGGDMGWHSLMELPPVFAAVVPTLDVNAIAGPLEAPNGFHIIKLLGMRQPDSKTPALSTEALRKRVSEALFQEKLQEKIQAWINEMRAGAYIHINNE